MTVFDRRTFRQEVRLDGDFDLAGNGAVHAGDLSGNRAASYRKVPAEPIAAPVSAASTLSRFPSSFQHSFDLKRARAAPNPRNLLLARPGRILSFVRVQTRIADLFQTVPNDVRCRSSCRTTPCGHSGCDRARRRLGAGRRGTGGVARAGRRARTAARSVSRAGAVADLHRSPAAQSPDLAHDPQLRIQRRHRDLHFHLGLHRGVRLRPRDARFRLRDRDRAHPAAGLADLRRPCVPVHDLSRRDFLRRHQFREPAILGRNGDHGFSQAAGRHHRPGAAAEISPRQHGRAAALHRADVFSALDPVADEVESRRHAGAVGRALCAHLAVRPASDGLSERLLGLQSVRLAIAVRVRRLVRAGRRQANVADSFVADHAVDFAGLSVRGVLRHADVVCAAARVI